MNSYRLLRSLSLLVLLCLGLAGASFAADRPNVILIMTDDQGYGDTSITGNTIVETPNMDRLAKEGAWLKRFYVSPVCTPTRAHLMTGRYNYRTRAIDTYLGRAVMEPEEVTLAEVLSEAGYATGIFGKWHLGDYFPTRSMDQGFQESVVHLGGGLRQPANPPEGDRYHDPILFHNGEPVRYEGYCTDIYFDEAAAYIEKQAEADQSFFVYVATNAPHGPFDEPPTRERFEHFLEKLPNRKREATAAFYAMIENVDVNIGRLLAKLEALEIDEETLVIFLTDNGPAGGGSAGPFRGAKGQVYEGGIRTVCFLRWPGTIEAGSSSDITAAHLDLMPTILDFCGVEEPEGVALDGRSVRSLIAEKGVAKAQVALPDRHLFFQWHRGDVPMRHQHFAAVDPEGRWKLLSARKPDRSGTPAEPQFELYDLHNDIAETQDLAGEKPEIVAELKAKYDAWFDEVGNTRDPNYGMPPIVVGAEEQKTVVLTPQDKRVDQADGQGWKAAGYWPLDVVREGPYTLQVRLTGEAPEALDIKVDVEIEGETWTKTLQIPRGLDSVGLGEVTLPGTGKGRLVARVQDGPGEPWVFQVTLK